jgi:hypothetical protein
MAVKKTLGGVIFAHPAANNGLEHGEAGTRGTVSEPHGGAQEDPL